MFRTIKLRVGIAMAYALVMIPLTLGMVVYLYFSNASLMRDTARQEMQRAAQTVRLDLQALMTPVTHFVEATAELVKNDVSRISSVQNLGYFHQQLKAMPQVFSVYAGFEGSGDFYQIFHIPDAVRELGPWRASLDDDVHYAVRYIDAASGERSDSYIFYRDWGEVAHVERVKALYDPRIRPWYRTAWQQDNVAISNAYVFSSSKIVGMTISYPVATSTGAHVGVVGADITLDSLSSFLKSSAIGQHGRVFILDNFGHLIGHADPMMGIRFLGGRVDLLPAVEVDDFAVADAVRMWKGKEKDYFEAELGEDGRIYMASFSKVKVGADQEWTIGVLVDEEDFIGPLKESSFKIVFAGIVVMSLAIAAISALSKTLTNPIQQIVEKTDRIKKFDLEGDLNITSRIREVHQLSEAVTTMTRSLRSFSVYVPRELVRSIVSEQGAAALVSRRQQLTVMMTDIQGYTSISEQQAPEDVVENLNAYFEQMSAAVHSHYGIVDKYIGDAVMAIWNAPKSDEAHISHACRAALVCHEASQDLAALAISQGAEPYITRIGLHTGEAVIGNVGSSDRMQYSAIGAVINLTARLEALNKRYGTNLLVSEDVAHAVWDEFLFRCVDKVIPVGTSQPIYIYELLSEKSVLAGNGSLGEALRMQAVWQAAMDVYFAGDWSQACDAFSSYQQVYVDDVNGGADKLARIFAGRCCEYSRTPPEDGWDGVLRLTSK